MATTDVLSSFILKLNHPLKEIRERSLQLLTAKLKLGWKLDDELTGTRQLLESLLAWFHVEKPSLQKEALDLFLTTIKTKSGNYIVKEFGIQKLLSSLNEINHKIAPQALETFEDAMDTLRFLNTVESDHNLQVPRLDLPEGTSSDSEGASNSGYYNIGPNIQTSKETSISSEECEFRKYDLTKPVEAVKLLLFPWVDLCTSDSKTLILIEDALRLLKSTRRCCRFIRDVFLWDFPAEIFLNRPEIVKSLITISDGNHSGRPAEALHVLLSITCALRKRLLQLSSIDLIHQNYDRISDHQSIDAGLHQELEQIAGDMLSPNVMDDGLAAIKQLPVPIYALDTLNAVLTIMARSVTHVEPVERMELLDLKELNFCLSLVENLVLLLLDCVNESFWTLDHKQKTFRDIAHKSCMVMRLLGDVLMKYRKSFSVDTTRCHHRVAWLRLVSPCALLVRWAGRSALPPAAAVAALQAARLDPALDLFYPELSARIADVLQNTRIVVDQEFKSKCRELKKLYKSMESAVQFLKSNNSLKTSKKVLTLIKSSLPVLEIFKNECYLDEIADIILNKTRHMDLNDSDWSDIRSIALSLMASKVEWVSSKFYRMLVSVVKVALVGEESDQTENEKSLTLICDVSILTEICCHGISSKSTEVSESASEIMIYLLRGRMVLSDGCWWRLLASLLPVLPLLHAHAAHDTPLGQAICKSLERDIAECMGISKADTALGLVRLLFVRCVAVQLDAAHFLCKMLDDERYLPPKESLRADVLLNALKRVEPQDFNIDYSSSPSKIPQSTTGLVQIVDVLKQDLTLEEHGTEYVTRRTSRPTLEPSLRRSMLQQLSVMLRQQDLHQMFLECDGLRVVVAILRMSLMVDDYLAFPESAISCVSVLNSVSFATRHSLAKVHDLPALLLRVILVFPANESAVLVSSQVLALIGWAGFALQELAGDRRRVPALPLCVTRHAALPFHVNSYWTSSSNEEHSYVEWLLAEEDWRAAIRVHWWYIHSGRSAVLLEGSPPAAPAALRPRARDLAALRAACPLYASTSALLALENATTHRQVVEAVGILESYVHLVALSSVNPEEVSSLPWQHTRRFLTAPPASARDTGLLTTLLHFVLEYMRHVPCDGIPSWVKSSFSGPDAPVVSLLGRRQLFPQQAAPDDIEVTQLRTYIVKVLLRCVICERNFRDVEMESLIKILLACIERIDLKNFHMLGYLNELMRCTRYCLNSPKCKLSEDTLLHGLGLATRTLGGCASGGGRKGQTCRLDAVLSLLALYRQIHAEAIPVQRWSEVWSSETVTAVVKCTSGARPELRAAALHLMAALAYYAQLMPHLLQAIEESSLSQFACRVIARRGEANIVRAAAAALLASIASRASPKTDILQCDVLEQLEDSGFLENCLEILVRFCDVQEYRQFFEPNVSLSLLERRSELEVRAQKCGDVHILPSPTFKGHPPPTAALVTEVTDALNNISGFPRCPVQEWNDRGLYRLLFRCSSWSEGTPSEVYSVRTATCRALLAVTSHKSVRTTLASTKDCLIDLFQTLTPLAEDETDPGCVSSRARALQLIGCLLPERAAGDSLWRQLREALPEPFFLLLLQSLETDETELQDAGLFCLTQLAHSTSLRKHVDKSRDDSCIQFYDNLSSPFINSQNDRLSQGDGDRNDHCQPEYMAEELCKSLINLYQKFSLDTQIYLVSQDQRWVQISSCLAAVLSASGRSRLYSVHRELPRTLLSMLQAVRDHLSVQGKPADVIRNADSNPALRTLYWVLAVSDASMVECLPAKQRFAEDAATSLARLWPWCMLTDQLRRTVVHMLLTFTNNCPKAWSAMVSCVGGRCLITEVSSLAVREAALQARPRPDALLLCALDTLRHCVTHHHCRTQILKSELMPSMYKLCMRERVRGASAASVSWAHLCAVVARYSDGAATLLALLGAKAAMAALPPTVRVRLMPALAHAAHHHRVTFLQSPDLLELLSGALLAGDTAEIVSAARAVWALAANNHKAKLLLRSAGVAAAVHSTLQRLQRCHTDAESQRALQLVTYTHTVLQAT